MNSLTIHLDASTPNYPTVRLLIDGEDVLPSTGMGDANDPADILDTGALLPTDPPRRIAFYGCGCGTFGCANVAGLIRKRGATIEWTDFRSLTGAYHSALPDPEDGADPATALDWDVPPTRHALPTFTFDADRYEAVVRDAMADHTWETRPRAIARLLGNPRTDVWCNAARHGDVITVRHRLTDGSLWVTDLPVPDGPVDRLAKRLAALLEDGTDPQRIAAAKLWT